MGIIKTHRNILAVGGARSGKTFSIIYFCVAMCYAHSGTRVLVARRYAKDAKESLWKLTVKGVIEAMGLRLGKDVTYNEQDLDARFPGGSVLRVAGLNDSERVDAVLGQEYSIIYLNETNDISFATVNKLRTRLSQKSPFGQKFICDLNPGSNGHWTHRLWVENVYPYDLRPLEADVAPHYGMLYMNPYDNRNNLAEDYIRQNLETLQGEDRKRFLLGEYSKTSELQVFVPENYFTDRDFFEWLGPRKNQIRLAAGLDIGYEDADALSVVAYIDGDPKTWLLYEYKARKKTVSELQQAILDAEEWLRDFLKTASFQLEIYGDTGGGGKKIVKEFNTVLSTPIIPAYKMDKRGAVDLLQEEINTPGRLHIREGGPFDKEAGQIIWTRNDNGDIERVIDEDTFHPDSMDSLLYPFRYLWSYGNQALRHGFVKSDDDPFPESLRDPRIPTFSLPPEVIVKEMEKELINGSGTRGFW